MTSLARYTRRVQVYRGGPGHGGRPERAEILREGLGRAAGRRARARPARQTEAAIAAAGDRPRTRRRPAHHRARTTTSTPSDHSHPHAHPAGRAAGRRDRRRRRRRDGARRRAEPRRLAGRRRGHARRRRAASGSGRCAGVRAPSPRPTPLVDDVELVILAVPDDAVGDVAASSAAVRGQAMVHTSGLLGAEVLLRPWRPGPQAGAFHPLVAFADIDRALAALQGATIAVEGDDHLAAHLADDGRGASAATRSGSRPGSKAAYHAAAVLAAGGVVALLDTIRELGRGHRPRRGRRAGDLPAAPRADGRQRAGAGRRRGAHRARHPRRRGDLRGPPRARSRAHAPGALHAVPCAAAAARRSPCADAPWRAGTGSGRDASAIAPCRRRTDAVRCAHAAQHRPAMSRPAALIRPPVHPRPRAASRPPRPRLASPAAPAAGPCCAGPTSRPLTAPRAPLARVAPRRRLDQRPARALPPASACVGHAPAAAGGPSRPAPPSAPWRG